MNVGNLSCCGVKELQSISSYATPQLVLKALCDRMWDRRYQNPNTEAYFNRLPSKPHGHYIFTGVIRHGRGEHPPTQNGQYGPNLAAYIQEHRLGQVVESYGAVNRVNSPTHVIKVWVWTPNPRNLRAWYGRHYGKRITSTTR